MVRREPVSKVADVYSYGILLWEIITQKVPFSDVNSYEVPAKIAAGEVKKLMASLNNLYLPCSSTRHHLKFIPHPSEGM